MTALLRAEWIRQRRRPDVWLLPILALAAAAFGWVTGLAGAESAVTCCYPPDQPPADLAQQLARAHDAFLFPAGFQLVATSGWIAWVAMVHFGSAWSGSEFVRGTIRNVFLVRPGRLGVFAVRLVAIGIVALLIVLADVVIALVLPAVAGLQGSGEAAPPSLVGLVVDAAAVWFVLWFLALASTTVAVVVRSGSAALLIVFVYSLIEVVVANWGIWRELGVLGWLPRLLPVERLIALINDAALATGFSHDEPFPDPYYVEPAIGVVVLAGWTALLIAVLVRRVRSMDIVE